ncbi:hypothetical protein VNO77_08858 [Canavalia gladiata]|uniref:Uncharacterized protein n=1 Tax=Canavalia gladiata TaxID=3824 RepID=A0AAN9QWB6_CANGL
MKSSLSGEETGLNYLQVCFNIVIILPKHIAYVLAIRLSFDKQRIWSPLPNKLESTIRLPMNSQGRAGFLKLLESKSGPQHEAGAGLRGRCASTPGPQVRILALALFSYVTSEFMINRQHSLMVIGNTQLLRHGLEPQTGTWL